MKKAIYKLAIEVCIVSSAMFGGMSIVQEKSFQGFCLMVISYMLLDVYSYFINNKEK